MSSDIPAAPTRIAAVRGAMQAEANTAAAIFEATATLLEALVRANGLTPARIVSVITSPPVPVNV